MSLLTKLPAEPGMNRAAESEIALADDGETEAICWEGTHFADKCSFLSSS